MRIRHCDGAPGYIVTGGMLGRAPHGTLIQTDWDYPATAGALGWYLGRVQRRHGRTVHLARVTIKTQRRPDYCRHRGTDGTITCPECGITAGDFIRAAGEYLDRRAS